MYILAANQIIDHQGDLAETDRIQNRLSKVGSKIAEFEIASSHDGWNAPLPKNRLRGACAPLTAFLRSRELFLKNQADAVIIHGKDFIKTDFHDKKDARNRLMQIYDDSKNGHILNAYNLLAHEFIKYWQFTPEEFRNLAQALFENHFSVWSGLHPKAQRPDSKWFEPVSDLFRGVDCANPSVDFEGSLILGTEEAFKECNLDLADCPKIVGCQIEEVGPDSLDSLPLIATYRHLQTAFQKACEQASIDFKKEFLSGNALLEVYTCYPVVPLGFLLATGMADSAEGICEFLKKYPLTITGGLNFAKAPFNNTTLSALVSMVKQLHKKNSPRIGGIHSVGATGYLQAFAILQKMAH